VERQTDRPDAAGIDNINQVKPTWRYLEHGNLIAASINREQELMALI
jgi:hypothetical protein